MSNDTTIPTAETSALFNESHRATYCPEDNKLRLYVGRVPREEYLKLRAEGWTALHKQREAGGGDFAATWTPSRRDTALEYAGIIEDEDMSPEERSADRAERFGGYRDKREGEATDHADRFDAGPSAHGFQSQDRAERAAARHDRIAGRAVDAWGNAEYWQRRTTGVIRHALHKSSHGVRMGRIKEIEAELRRDEKTREEWAAKWRLWQKVAALTDPALQLKQAELCAGIDSGGYDYKHPHNGRKGSLWSFLREDAADRITGAEACALYFAAHTDPDSPAWEETRIADWMRHHKLRLAYENQMIEAAGGRAAFVEMVPGGFIGSRQIQKVNKSAVTSRVVSVAVWGTHRGFSKASGYTKQEEIPCLVNIETERLPADAYRAPTAEELAAFEAEKKARKATAPKKEVCPLINPTDADAERLQALWNERGLAAHQAGASRYGRDFQPAKITRITQAIYSAASKGSYARAETRGVSPDGELQDRDSNLYCRQTEERRKRIGAPVCNLRVTSGGDGYFTPRSIIILTDKPQKPLPESVWQKPVLAALVNASEALT